MDSSETPRKRPSQTSSGRSRIPSWAGDVLAVVVVAVASAFPGPMPPQQHPAFFLAIPAVVIAAVVLIPLRRRWPIPIFAVSLVLYCATAVFGTAQTGLGIVAVIAAYSVGAQTSRRATLISGAIGTAAVALLSLTVSDFGVVEPRVFQIAAGIAVAAALGDSSRSYREFLRAATERAERAEKTREAEAQQRVAEERLRIAQDLHDTVAHQISVISLNAGVATGALDKNPAKVREALGRIRTSSREVLKEIGNLLGYLRTDAEPVTTAPPQPGIDDVDALVERVKEAGLRVEVHREGDLRGVPASTGRVVYRVVQEGLTNAHKHGSRRTSTVRIVAGRESMQVTVTNPVSAERRNQPDPYQGGLGLLGIRERVASVHGTVDVTETADTFTLAATLPLQREEQP